MDVSDFDPLSEKLGYGDHISCREHNRCRKYKKQKKCIEHNVQENFLIQRSTPRVHKCFRSKPTSGPQDKTQISGDPMDSLRIPCSIEVGSYLLSIYIQKTQKSFYTKFKHKENLISLTSRTHRLGRLVQRIVWQLEPTMGKIDLQILHLTIGNSSFRQIQHPTNVE